MVIFEHPDFPFQPSHLLIFLTEDTMQQPIYQATNYHIEFEPFSGTDLAQAAPLNKLTDLNGNNYREAHYTGFNGGNGIKSAWVCILEFDPDPMTPYVEELGYIISDWDS